MDNKYTVAVTAIILHEGKALITKRTASKKKWPNKWTVPGGKVEDADFLGTPTEINNQWYNTLENAVVREVKEETGLRIGDISYLCNIAVPGTIILSYIAELDDDLDNINLQLEECDEYAWIGIDDLDKYDLIEGLEEELFVALQNV